MDLPKGKELYFLVGQEGSSACLKVLTCLLIFSVQHKAFNEDADL